MTPGQELLCQHHAGQVEAAVSQLRSLAREYNDIVKFTDKIIIELHRVQDENTRLHTLLADMAVIMREVTAQHKDEECVRVVLERYRAMTEGT